MCSSDLGWTQDLKIEVDRILEKPVKTKALLQHIARLAMLLLFCVNAAETVAHLRSNGRITLMFCAFDGPPNIVRLYGAGEVIEPQDPPFALLRGLFPPTPGVRAIIRVRVHRVADSCGFGVPMFDYRGQRTQLTAWAERKGEDALRDYQRQKNTTSIDGLPALRWTTSD